MLNGGDDFAKVMKWYKIKDFIDYGDTRENLITYLKNIQYIDSKNYIDSLNPRILIIGQNFLRNLIDKILKYFYWKIFSILVELYIYIIKYIL